MLYQMLAVKLTPSVSSLTFPSKNTVTSLPLMPLFFASYNAITTTVINASSSASCSGSGFAGQSPSQNFFRVLQPFF
jgi:hypothetical protein